MFCTGKCRLVWWRIESMVNAGASRSISPARTAKLREPAATGRRHAIRGIGRPAAGDVLGELAVSVVAGSDDPDGQVFVRSWEENRELHDRHIEVRTAMAVAAVAAASVAACGSSSTKSSTSTSAMPASTSAMPASPIVATSHCPTLRHGNGQLGPPNQERHRQAADGRFHPGQQSRDAHPPGQLRSSGGCPGPIPRCDRQRRRGDRHHDHQLAAIPRRSRRRHAVEHPSGSRRATGRSRVPAVYADLLRGHQPCRIDDADHGAAAPAARPTTSGVPQS